MSMKKHKSITKQRKSTNKYNKGATKVSPFVWIVLGVFIVLVITTVVLAIPSKKTKLYNSYNTAAQGIEYRGKPTDDAKVFSDLVVKDEFYVETINKKKFIQQISNDGLVMVYTGSPSGFDTFIKFFPALHQEFINFSDPHGEGFNKQPLGEEIPSDLKGFKDLGLTTIYNFQFDLEKDDFSDIFDEIKEANPEIRIKNQPEIFIIKDKKLVDSMSVADLLNIDSHGQNRTDVYDFFLKVLKTLTIEPK